MKLLSILISFGILLLGTTWLGYTINTYFINPTKVAGIYDFIHLSFSFGLIIGSILGMIYSDFKGENSNTLLYNVYLKLRNNIFIMILIGLGLLPYARLLSKWI